MPQRARRTRSSTNGTISAAGDAASVISIASTVHVDRVAVAPPSRDDFDEDALRDRYDLHALELLEQELLQVQTLKSETQSQIELLLEEQKKLEIMERREKVQSAKKASHGNRMSRIEQLQEQERVRHQQLQATREQEEQKRKAKAEEARRKQANSIQTRDDEDLDDFLAHESSGMSYPPDLQVARWDPSDAARSVSLVACITNKSAAESDADDQFPLPKSSEEARPYGGSTRLSEKNKITENQKRGGWGTQFPKPWTPDAKPKPHAESYDKARPRAYTDEEAAKTPPLFPLSPHLKQRTRGTFRRHQQRLHSLPLFPASFPPSSSPRRSISVSGALPHDHTSEVYKMTVETAENHAKAEASATREVVPASAVTDAAAMNNNRKRKMSPVGPGGLSRGNKFVRPNPNVNGGAAVVPQQGSIHTSDSFIDHQRAMFHADTAPTPHGPVANMPPTPAFGNRGFSHTPDGFDSTPTDDGFPSNSSLGAGGFSQNGAEGEGGFENDSASGSKAQTTTPSPLPRAAPLNLRNFANWNVSSRYTLVRLLGKGSYGQVAEAFDTVRQKKVAIKKIINVFDQEIDCKRLYREIYILRHLAHPQVINLLDVIPPENFDSFSDLYLVMEFVDTDLHKLIMSPQYLTIRHIQVFLYQLLCGLKYIHSANVIHRDMKPANILLNEDCTLMICDFGLSRVMESDLSMEELAKHLYSPKDAKSPTTPSDATSPGSASSTPSSSNGAGGSDAPKFKRQLTKHVVTRWYRAPELILLQDYSFAVDMWSVGCIFAELLSMQVESCPRYQERVPLFPGRSCFPLSADRPTTYSDKLDQLNVIFNVIGTPNEEDIGALGEVKQYLRKLPKKDARDFREMYPGAPADSLDLLKKMLSFNPDCRISVDQALEHPFLQAVRRTQSETVEPNPFGMEFENVALDKETLKARIVDEIKLFAERNNR